MGKPLRLLILTGLMLLMAQPSALAQENIPDRVSVTTPYVGVSIKPGESASFPIDVAGPPQSRVALTLENLPDDWGGRLQGGGFVVDEVQLGDTGRVSVNLDIDVPASSPEGSYPLALEATGTGGSDRLALSVTVAAAVGGEVTLSTDFPDLRGPSDSTYSFSLVLDNGTPQEIQFGLTVQGPPGWQVDAKPAGEAKASTVTVGGGDTSNVTVSVDPPDTAAAGKYVVVARADGGGETATMELGIEITGTYDMTLTTASDVLNLDVHAGQATELPLVLYNTGSAPLQGVSLSATPPSGWDVSYSPSVIDDLEPGASIAVTATITASDQAINGDYLLTLSASVPEAQASSEIRATVVTSAIWGLVGVAVIVAALGGLTMVFRRYGRR